MSCGGSHSDNANAAVISDTVKTINSTFDRDAARQRIAEARKEHESRRAAAYIAKHGPDAAWAAPLLIDTDQNSAQYLNDDKTILTTVALDEAEVFAGGWHEPRYRSVDGYEGTVEMKMEPSEEFPGVYVLTNSPNAPLAVRLDEHGEADKFTIDITYAADDLNKEHPIPVLSPGWSDADEDALRDIGREELDSRLTIENYSDQELYIHTYDGVPVVRYDEIGYLAQPEPDPDAYRDE